MKPTNNAPVGSVGIFEAVASRYVVGPTDYGVTSTVELVGTGWNTPLAIVGGRRTGGNDTTFLPPLSRLLNHRVQVVVELTCQCLARPSHFSNDGIFGQGFLLEQFFWRANHWRLKAEVCGRVPLAVCREIIDRSLDDLDQLATASSISKLPPDVEVKRRWYELRSS